MQIRISAISYLNTLPFIYGLKSSSLYPQEIDLRFSTPERAAKDLIRRSVDLGIVPSAIIPQIGKDRIISDYCIGAEGEVASVLLCSGKPVSDIDHLFLDCESTTSALLTRILFRKHWRSEPSYSLFNANLEEIDSSLSYLLIGDKALLNGGKFKY
ncbi:MAG: MqnA/MqnD/SBP family protein, partial [Bacteroidales bacterium]|nr:MqnA/MqnD/SBP family protein [Bacteroidales bacterium]